MLLVNTAVICCYLMWVWPVPRLFAGCISFTVLLTPALGDVGYVWNCRNTSWFEQYYILRRSFVFIDLLLVSGKDSGSSSMLVALHSGPWMSKKCVGCLQLGDCMDGTMASSSGSYFESWGRMTEISYHSSVSSDEGKVGDVSCDLGWSSRRPCKRLDCSAYNTKECTTLGWFLLTILLEQSTLSIDGFLGCLVTGGKFCLPQSISSVLQAKK